MKHLAMLYVLLTFTQPISAGEKALDLERRRELFVDEFLIDKRQGTGIAAPCAGATRRGHGSRCAFGGDRLWLSHGLSRPRHHSHVLHRRRFDERRRRQVPVASPWFACYAESKDGMHWTRADLGLFEFNGSKKNTRQRQRFPGQESIFLGNTPSLSPLVSERLPACSHAQFDSQKWRRRRCPRRDTGDAADVLCTAG
jgi:hypothetical protein